MAFALSQNCFTTRKQKITCLALALITVPTLGQGDAVLAQDVSTVIDAVQLSPSTSAEIQETEASSRTETGVRTEAQRSFLSTLSRARR